MNRTERAKELIANIENAAINLTLSNAGVQNACVNVPAEEDCDNSYAAGQRFAVDLQTHVSKAGSYMQQISDIIEQADQASVLRTFSLKP